MAAITLTYLLGFVYSFQQMHIIAAMLPLQQKIDFKYLRSHYSIIHVLFWPKIIAVVSHKCRFEEKPQQNSDPNL